MFHQLLSLALLAGSSAVQRAVTRAIQVTTAPLAAQQPSAPAPGATPVPGGWSFQIGGTTVQAVAASATAGAAPAPGLHAFWIDAPHPSPPLANIPLRDQEIFVLGVPPQPAPTGAPLLVAFHGFGVGPDDVIQNTDFWDECQARGWYLLAPLSRSPLGSPQIHYAEVEAQDNTAAALEWVTAQLPVDPDRIYGIGFSMGGSMAVSYAARHLDPDRPMIAATVCHTGSVDQAHTWQAISLSGNPSAAAEIELDFGGAPAVRPFEYRRSSLIELDLSTGIPVPQGRHLVSNLRHVPTYVWYSTADPESHLITQCQEFSLLLSSSGNPASIQTVVGDPVHSWSTLDSTTVFNWLSTQQLALPLNGTLQMDTDGAWFHFDVQRGVANAFGSLQFDISSTGSMVEILGSENVEEITTALGDWGVTPAMPLVVRLGSVDGGDLVRVGIGGVVGPTIALRDGVLVSQGAGWVFHGGTGEVVVDERGNSGVHTWEFF